MEEGREQYYWYWYWMYPQKLCFLTCDVVSTLDERQYILSAVTHGIRSNWIAALRTGANLGTLTPDTDTPRLTCREWETIQTVNTAKLTPRTELLRVASPLTLLAPSTMTNTEFLPSSPPLALKIIVCDRPVQW